MRPVTALEDIVRMVPSFANDAIAITEAEVEPPGPQIIWVNEAQCRITGYAPAELIGQTPRLFHGPLTARSELDRIRQALETAQPVRAQLINYRKNGQPHHVDLSISPIFAAEGRLTHFMSIKRDIDEAKQREIELEVARREAAEANRAKSEFLARMSHDLRTPLNAILGFSDVIRNRMMGPLGTEVYADYASDIYDSGTILLHLINDILDLSKIEAGRYEPDPQPIDLDLMIRRVVRLSSNMAGGKGLSLEVVVPPSLPTLIADETAVRRILFNLLSNAVKFTPRGGRVTVTVERDRPGGLVLRVSDTGIGIAPGELGRVKEAFSQVRHRLNNPEDGVGLGLAIVDRLVDLHGGQVDIQSCPGQGTTVSVVFPPACVKED